ncbi:2-polyprenyl-3-methyl-5-hydroxy-6-metoxy-1,4-benzoquinol methylase [Pseudolabrys sp. Root1462]|nr:2-polyprenyl-3-methyl-5-hydroxy-6-metoxy-1,4-benzoquinol methylase [Pseudolabrys sp. Root1462]
MLPAHPVGADLGCGSGRWAALVAPKVGKLYAVDASAMALAVAKNNLTNHSNVEFHHCDVSQLPFPAGSLDFAFSLGVLHHLPDTQRALSDIASRLKPGAPFLVYLYYSMDNRPVWFRSIWVMTDWLRLGISRLPHALKIGSTTALAGLVYWPLARIARLLEKLGLRFEHIPLAFYRDKPFYVLRTDAYDRFSTRLEQRFSKLEIQAMLLRAGFTDIRFSDHEPYWCAVGIRAGG